MDEVNAPRRAERDAGVVEPPVEGVEAGAKPDRPEVQAVAERFEAALEARDAGEGAAPLQRVERRGG